MRFVAFPATEYDEVLSGYQPGEIVFRCYNSNQRARTEMGVEKLVFSPINNLPRLIARENFLKPY
jgi:hypothetical protein